MVAAEVVPVADDGNSTVIALQARRTHLHSVLKDREIHPKPLPATRKRRSTNLGVVMKARLNSRLRLLLPMTPLPNKLPPQKIGEPAEVAMTGLPQEEEVLTGVPQEEGVLTGVLEEEETQVLEEVVVTQVPEVVVTRVLEALTGVLEEEVLTGVLEEVIRTGPLLPLRRPRTLKSPASGLIAAPRTVKRKTQIIR